MQFVTDHYKGGGFDPNTKEGRAAQTHYAVWNATNWLSNYKVLTTVKWARTSKLRVVPEAGQDLNAYYDGRSLQFFYFTDPVTKEKIYTCNSPDVVCHESGHGILDSHKPQLFNMSAFEAGAFHEGFADTVAVLVTLQNPEVVNLVLQQTGGDLTRPNCVAYLAEQFGKSLYNYVGGRGGYSPLCLRNALNTFQYSDPGKLPQNGPDTKIIQEVHSFGRIIVGAMYDVLAGMYLRLKALNNPPDVALRTAAATLSRYVLKAIAYMPLNVRIYDSFAKTMLWVDAQEKGTPYTSILKNVFTNRKMITPTVKMLEAAPPCTSQDNIMHMGGVKGLKIADHVVSVQSNNPLLQVEMEMPHEGAYFYDANKNLMDYIMADDQETLAAAQHAAQHLHSKDLVGDRQDQHFRIENHKLVRKYFNCKCCH
jgi:hypothetical protein